MYFTCFFKKSINIIFAVSFLFSFLQFLSGLPSSSDPKSVQRKRRLKKINVEKKKFCAAYNTHRHDDNASNSSLSDGSETEEYSDISDDSDIFHLCVNAAKDWTTEQDKDAEKIEEIAKLLRRNPFVPPDPSDTTAERDWEDVQSGVALPRVHCAFSGCKWVDDSKDSWEDNLRQHVQREHLQSMKLSKADAEDFYDFYEAAIEHQAQEMMPTLGVSIDRRSLRYVTDTFNDDSVYSLVCAVCAQMKTHTGLFSRRVNGCRRKLTDIEYRSGSELCMWRDRNLTHFDNNFGFRTFMQRYGQEWKVEGRSDEDLQEFGPTRREWQRLLKRDCKDKGYELLCCPEDVHCEENHPPEEICKKCQVPICSECHKLLTKCLDVPMALANDNMWGYISSIIMQYQVRWIEMAAVLPYWTCMIVYYVEADRGHLMNEVLKENQHRSAVRGQAFSFIMPWDEIVKSLHRRIKSIPRDPECLKYMLRLHLKVAGQDFHQHLKQVHLRPGILVLLLEELFTRKHEAFLESYAAQCMQHDWEHAVFEKYPETEDHIPLDERKGFIPDGIREEIEESVRKMEERCEKKRRVIHTTKNATPGDAEQELQNCLDDVRPKAFTLDLKPSDCSNPDSIRGGALERYGELDIQTGNQLVSQWESKYFSLILPFVIPRMVSGPDFRPENKWRRLETSPLVSPKEFIRGMARRIEGQIRNDATAVPIMRSVLYKWSVEHSSSMIVPYIGHQGRPSSVIATEMVKAAQGLYRALWQGMGPEP